jgi:hypothetical protein
VHPSSVAPAHRARSLRLWLAPWHKGRNCTRFLARRFDSNQDPLGHIYLSTFRRVTTSRRFFRASGRASAAAPRTVTMGVYGFFAGVVGVLHLLLLYVGMFFMCNVIPILSMLFISPIFSGVHQVTTESPPEFNTKCGAIRFIHTSECTVSAIGCQRILFVWT